MTGLQYDGNGNILALNRYKEDNSVIDQLSYSYIAGSNRLSSVTDAINPTPEDWDAEDTEFGYDGNGNVNTMLENGVPVISSIQYDHRNLPVSLVNRNGDLVTYRYNASGQRIYKKNGSQTAEHYILDGDQTVAVFENGVVSRSDPFRKVLEYSGEWCSGQAGCRQEQILLSQRSFRQHPGGGKFLWHRGGGARLLPIWVVNAEAQP